MNCPSGVIKGQNGDINGPSADGNVPRGNTKHTGGQSNVPSGAIRSLSGDTNTTCDDVCPGGKLSTCFPPKELVEQKILSNSFSEKLWML